MYQNIITSKTDYYIIQNRNIEHFLNTVTVKGGVRYIFASLFFRSKREHLSN